MQCKVNQPSNLWQEAAKQRAAAVHAVTQSRCAVFIPLHQNFKFKFKEPERERGGKGRKREEGEGRGRRRGEEKGEFSIMTCGR